MAADNPYEGYEKLGKIKAEHEHRLAVEFEKFTRESKAADDKAKLDLVMKTKKPGPDKIAGPLFQAEQQKDLFEEEKD